MSDFPAMIGRYRIESVLGRGAMGVVYKGHDPEIDRPVAIKLVRADLLSGAERDDYLARFRQEARAAGRCMHPNIVGIYDFALHDGNPFLTMEFIEGISLSQAFEGGARFKPPEAIAMTLQVLDALAYAHDRGIVHRDIKPANILVLPEGTIKVGDFGISRVRGSELTMTGSVIGTPSYMSPEQCRGEAVDQRSDLFSTGTVLFQLLTGEKPFPGNSITEIVYRLLNEEPPELDSKGVLVSEAAAAALRQALAKRPQDRFASARDMADALRRGLGVGDAEERTVVVRDANMYVTFADAGPALPLFPGEGTAAAVGEDSGSRFDDAVLSRIERNLAQYVGPMAKLLVRTAAAKSNTTADLCAGLAQHISTPKDRAEFLIHIRTLSRLRQNAGKGEDSIPPTAPASAAPAGPPLPAEAVARVQRDLALVLGPIARLLVQRAATGVASVQELREKLAANIKGEAERRRFLSGGASR